MKLADLRFIASMLASKTSIDDSTVVAVVKDAITKTELLREYQAEDARFRGVVLCQCARCVQARGLEC